MLQLALIVYHPPYYTLRIPKQVQQETQRTFLEKPSFALDTSQPPPMEYRPPSTHTPKLPPSVARDKALAMELLPGFKHAILVSLRIKRVQKAWKFKTQPES